MADEVLGHRRGVPVHPDQERTRTNVEHVAEVPLGGGRKRVIIPIEQPVMEGTAEKRAEERLAIGGAARKLHARERARQDRPARGPGDDEPEPVQRVPDIGAAVGQRDGRGRGVRNRPAETAEVGIQSRHQAGGLVRRRGEDPMQNFSRSLRANARLIENFPGVTFGIHLCRGNQRSMWHREGSYDAIAERLFNELPHQRFLLEYDSPRAGSFAPLRFVPKDKVVVLGLVSTKVPELEPTQGDREHLQACFLDEATKEREAAKLRAATMAEAG